MRGRHQIIGMAAAACFTLGAAIPAIAQDAGAAADSLPDFTIESMMLETPDMLFAPPGGIADQAWHQRFTFGGAADPGYRFNYASGLGDDWGVTDIDLFEFTTGNRWSFSLEFDRQDDDLLDFDSVRAGAFFDVTSRMRLGGALTFTSPEEGLTRVGESGSDEPEIRLESAFRF